MAHLGLLVWAVLINELFAARQALFKSDGRFLVSHCCDLALLFGGIQQAGRHGGRCGVVQNMQGPVHVLSEQGELCNTLIT